MNRRRRPAPVTRRGLLVAGAGAATAAVVAAARDDAGPRPEPAPVPRLFVLGDSWAAGLHADPDRALGQVAARLLGWPVTVDAASGTGYLATTAAAAAYPDRLARSRRRVDDALGVAVLQGGSNDHASPPAQLLAAARATVALVADVLPNHRVVMLGPGPDPEPVTAEQRAVDLVLAQAARRSAVPYVSMLRQDWIPAAEAASVLDPENHHPTVAGQQYLGRRLAAALRSLHPDLVARPTIRPGRGE